jgi:5-methylcytosine-specific restriction endonuclease McrA
MATPRKEIMKKYNSKPEVKARKRQWYLDNRDRAISRASESQKNNPNRKSNALRYYYKRFFGLSDIPEKGHCGLCGTTEDLHIHHRDENNGRNGREVNNNEDNLVSLCRGCHAGVHWKLRKGESDGLF